MLQLKIQINLLSGPFPTVHCKINHDAKLFHHRSCCAVLFSSASLERRQSLDAKHFLFAKSDKQQTRELINYTQFK